jgi:hypothetical protein
MKTMMDRRQMATEAFWGKNDALYSHLEQMASYEKGGVTWAANGLSLEDCVRLAEAMTEEEWDVALAVCC